MMKSLEIKEKIAIMTHDDVFDDEIYNYEKSIGAKSTFFLLSYELNKKLDKAINFRCQVGIGAAGKENGKYCSF